MDSTTATIRHLVLFQSRVLVKMPENLMQFFESFQRPGCDTSGSADIAHAPPDNSTLGNAVSMQGLGPSRQQTVTAETRGLPGNQTSSPRSQNNPCKPHVCYLLSRASQAHLLRSRISPFRCHFPAFSKGSFKSRWDAFQFKYYFGTSSIFKGKINISMPMEKPIFYLKPLLEIRRTYLSVGTGGEGKFSRAVEEI